MKRTFGSISKCIVLLMLAVPLSGQDTLRTYGPRIGIDLARIAYLFADPSETGAELSLDAELFRNIYPVVEIGYSGTKDQEPLFDYSSSGFYTRVGVDYNLLPVKDRSLHHTITAGLRWGISFFSHQAETMVIPNSYWGDYIIDEYENTLVGNWLEVVGGIRAEVVPNLFLGWAVRYRILLNPDMDPQVTPGIIPGFGSGKNDRGIGLTYSVSYMIPLLRK